MKIIVWLFAIVLGVSPATAAAELPAAVENHPGLLVEPLTFRADDGTRLRAVVTRPTDSGKRRPAILFVQWLSCDTVAIPARPTSGWEKMLQQVVRQSNALVWRTEKRGVGGSEGDCTSLDYDTELRDHRTALGALRQRPDVDPNRIVIFGASMGATMAPLLAQGDDRLAGVVVWGGGARSWAERTLAFERNRLELGNGPPEGRLAEISARYRLINDVLVLGRSPQQAAAVDGALAGAWKRMAGTTDTTMYGRPLSFHQQAQRHDWAASWARVRVPVLAMLGEYDWFEDAGGVLLIRDIVNRARPGQATAAIIPGLDHHFNLYANQTAAFAERGGTAHPGRAMAVLMPWLQARLNT